jgi:carbonic anhydrase
MYQGSEHQLDSKKFPLEMHMLHFTLSDDKYEDQTAVLGFFFEVNYLFMKYQFIIMFFILFKRFQLKIIQNLIFC